MKNTPTFSEMQKKKHAHTVLLIWKDDNHSIFYNNIFIPFHQCLLNWSTFTLKKTQILHLHIALIRLQNVFLFISLLNWIKAPLHSRKNFHLHNVLFRLPEDHLNIVSLWLQYCYSRSVQSVELHYAKQKIPVFSSIFLKLNLFLPG